MGSIVTLIGEPGDEAASQGIVYTGHPYTAQPATLELKSHEHSVAYD